MDQHLNVIFSLDFGVGVLKFPKLGIPQLWKPITLYADLWLRWAPKKSCSLCQDLCNDMWHATCTQGNQRNSQLLVVERETGNLTPSPSFGHNLCFRYPNGSCEPILNIHVPRAFQCYKKIFNPMRFDPWNHLLKIQKSIGTPTPKMGAHLGVWGFIPSHSLTLLEAWNVILGLHSWPAPLQALALVANPRLRLWQGDIEACCNVATMVRACRSWWLLKNMTFCLASGHQWRNVSILKLATKRRQWQDSRRPTTM
jgi:hypothetical protein